jgi:hypothetical protein
MNGDIDYCGPWVSPAPERWGRSMDGPAESLPIVTLRVMVITKIVGTVA